MVKSVTPDAAILLVRISDDRLGEEKGVKRQIEDGRQLAARLGWTIGPAKTHVVVENDVSAFKRRKVRLPDGSTGLRVVRPAFRGALDMLATGEADGLIAYDLDRTVRDPRDLEDLIDVVEARQIPTKSVTGSLNDLHTDAGLTMARMMVAVANKSSRDTGRRVARAHADRAAAGEYGGGGLRPFGYERDGMTVRRAEAEIVQWMVACILGEVPPPKGRDRWSLSAIAEELTRRGVPTSQGAAKWSSGSVRVILRGPRIAGLRRYKGEIVATAKWPALVPVDRWETVCAVLAQNPRTQPKLKRWLTGVLKCYHCGHMLRGWHGPGRGEKKLKYWCASGDRYDGCGKISVVAVDAEAEIERQVLALLAKPRVLETLRLGVERANAEALRADIAADDTQLRELAGMWARKEITLGEYRESRAIIEKRLSENRSMLRDMSPVLMRRLLAGDPVEAWGGLAPADKRQVVQLLCDHVTVLPFPKHMPRRKFWPGRLLPVGGPLGDSARATSRTEVSASRSTIAGE